MGRTGGQNVSTFFSHWGDGDETRSLWWKEELVAQEAQKFSNIFSLGEPILMKNFVIFVHGKWGRTWAKKRVLYFFHSGRGDARAAADVPKLVEISSNGLLKKCVFAGGGSTKGGARHRRARAR